MQPDSNAFVMRTAMDLFKARQPLAAALVYAELAQGGFAVPELWCGLGSSLMASRGRLVRKPFETWAAKAFRRGAPSFAGTPYASVVQDWLAELPEANQTAPLDDAEIPTMIEFLLVNERVLPDAAKALTPDNAMSLVMGLGDRKSPLYVPLLREAVEGKLGDGAARSALKRIGTFLDWPEMQASLLAAKQSPNAEEMGPYLSFVLDRLPAGWDAARTTACPPYQGIGRIHIELTSAGSNPSAIQEILRERLNAAPRDAESWVKFAPCIIKKGAMRDDALRLKSTLEPLGAALTLHNLTWSHDAPPTQPKPTKPWWKFW